jgi:cytidine deaminase
MKDCIFRTRIKVCSWDELTDAQQSLISEAKQMTAQSYSPYSHFRVGAAARLEGGVVVKGSNQENAAYPSGLCAERTTLFAANANYPDRAVESLAIACRRGELFTAKPGAPCGSCRQVMIETEHRYGRPMEVLLYGEDEIYVIESAQDLMPLGFFAENLLEA